MTASVALVTGASRGLGAALGRHFASEGLSVALCARHEPQAPSGSNSMTASVDVADHTAIEEFAERVESQLGPIALWVNNAGLLEPIAPLRRADPTAIDEALAVNVGGVAHGTATFVRRARGRATAEPHTLINISSGAARSIYEGWSVYGATKAAVDHLTEIVAAEEPTIGIWSVAPGVVDTDMQALIRAQRSEDFPAVERFVEIARTAQWTPAARVAEHILALHRRQVTAETVHRVPD